MRDPSLECHLSLAQPRPTSFQSSHQRHCQFAPLRHCHLHPHHFHRHLLRRRCLESRNVALSNLALVVLADTASFASVYPSKSRVLARASTFPTVGDPHNLVKCEVRTNTSESVCIIIFARVCLHTHKAINYLDKPAKSTGGEIVCGRVVELLDQSAYMLTHAEESSNILFGSIHS